MCVFAPWYTVLSTYGFVFIRGEECGAPLVNAAQHDPSPIYLCAYGTQLLAGCNIFDGTNGLPDPCAEEGQTCTPGSAGTPVVSGTQCLAQTSNPFDPEDANQQLAATYAAGVS